MKKRKSNLQNFHDEGVAYLTGLISEMDILKQQELFYNCIKVIDKTFLDSMSITNQEKSQFFTDILHFAYPILIEYAYTDKFADLPATVLSKLTEESLFECRSFLSACQLVGWSAYFLELERLKIVEIKDFLNKSKIIFLQKNHCIELIESKFIEYYERIISEQLENDPRYKENAAKREDIVQKMKNLCFVWKEHFIGYDVDQEIESHFNDLAYIDAIHDSEWDMYPNDVLFDNIAYETYVDSIVDFGGYAIKHIYFANILKNKHPELIFENLLSPIKMQVDLLKLIQENGELSDKQAEIVLNILSLSPNNKQLFFNTQAYCAPLIRISKNQYIHSCAGTLYHPFSFMLDNLTKLYPNECNANRTKREAIFRKQLYDMMSNFCCIDRQIIIAKNGQRLTDIDATIIDPKTGEIALFQLKWQDHTSLSPKTLLSKSKNYNNEVNAWVEKITSWIEYSSNDEIACVLGIKTKFVDKSKIYLFALGREHGNYSGVDPQTPNCVWLQWFHFLNYILRVGKNNCRISDMHKDLKEESPYKIKIKSKSKVYKYGKYIFIIK